MADKQSFIHVRYPDFPRIPISLQNNESGIREAWDNISRWGASFIRALEEADSQNVNNVIVDANKSIDISGRIKVADIAATVTAQSGDIRYNSSTNKHQGYNGSSWNDMY